MMTDGSLRIENLYYNTVRPSQKLRKKEFREHVVFATLTLSCSPPHHCRSQYRYSSAGREDFWEDNRVFYDQLAQPAMYHHHERPLLLLMFVHHSFSFSVGAPQSETSVWRSQTTIREQVNTQLGFYDEWLHGGEKGENLEASCCWRWHPVEWIGMRRIYSCWRLRKKKRIERNSLNFNFVRCSKTSCWIQAIIEFCTIRKLIGLFFWRLLRDIQSWELISPSSFLPPSLHTRPLNEPFVLRNSKETSFLKWL